MRVYRGWAAGRQAAPGAADAPSAAGVLRRLALWGLLMFLASCATIATPPTVSLAGVDIESLGLFEQRFLLQLRIRNPNPVDIPVEGLDFTVELNGRHFADGISNMALTIPRQGEALLAVRARSDLAAFLRQWKDLEKAGRPGLDYRVKGKLRVSGRGGLPFDHRGEVAWPKLPVPDSSRFTIGQCFAASISRSSPKSAGFSSGTDSTLSGTP